MARYFNPPESLPHFGRELEGTEFPKLVEQLNPVEVVVGYYKLPSHRIAVAIEDLKEFEHFEYAVTNGDNRRLGFYALSRMYLH